MTEAATKADARKNMYPWIAAGLSSGIALNILAWLYWPRMAPVTDPVDRLLLALQCCSGVGFVALVMLQGLWRLPDGPRAEDPFANAESRGWKINQRVLTNTLEQALIFVPIFIGLSIRMDAEYAYMLPALMTIWCAGRFVFWAGYRHSLNARAIGMDWTTVTTVVAATWFVITLF
jgi:hypothetical protein